jgi:hypothetical protein
MAEVETVQRIENERRYHWTRSLYHLFYSILSLRTRFEEIGGHWKR